MQDQFWLSWIKGHDAVGLLDVMKQLLVVCQEICKCQWLGISRHGKNGLWSQAVGSWQMWGSFWSKAQHWCLKLQVKFEDFFYLICSSQIESPLVHLSHSCDSHCINKSRKAALFSELEPHLICLLHSVLLAPQCPMLKMSLLLALIVKSQVHSSLETEKSHEWTSWVRCIASSTWHSGLVMQVILWSIMGSTLAEQYMQCVMSKHWLSVVYSSWVRKRMSQKNHWQLSPFHYSLCLPSDRLSQCSPSRQRKEYKVFQQLLKMVPLLSECLMETSEEECMMMADLVGVSVYPSVIAITLCRPLKIQKGIASARFKTTHSYHHPITGALLCPVELDWNNTECGSIFPFFIWCWAADLGFAQSFPVAKWLCKVINGHCWCMQSKNSIVKNPGMGSSEVSFFFGSVCSQSNLHSSW